MNVLYTLSIRGGALEAAFEMAIGITTVVPKVQLVQADVINRQCLPHVTPAVTTSAHPAGGRVGTEFSAPRSQSPRLKAMAFHSLPPLYVRGHCTFKQ